MELPADDARLAYSRRCGRVNMINVPIKCQSMATPSQTRAFWARQAATAHLMLPWLSTFSQLPHSISFILIFHFSLSSTTNNQTCTTSVLLSITLSLNQLSTASHVFPLLVTGGLCFHLPQSHILSTMTSSLGNLIDYVDFDKRSLLGELHGALLSAGREYV